MCTLNVVQVCQVHYSLKSFYFNIVPDQICPGVVSDRFLWFVLNSRWLGSEMAGKLRKRHAIPATCGQRHALSPCHEYRLERRAQEADRRRDQWLDLPACVRCLIGGGPHHIHTARRQENGRCIGGVKWLLPYAIVTWLLPTTWVARFTA